jgi:hypothetical protein
MDSQGVISANNVVGETTSVSLPQSSRNSMALENLDNGK